MRKLRIVSLLPSATEMVCALGAGDCLVGRSHECDYPPSVLSLPVCTASKVDARAGSAEIDRQVRDLVRDSASAYRLDSERIRQLRPDLILTQAQCEVCAVSLAEVEAAVSQWSESKPRLVSLSPKRIVDIWEDLKRVAEALDVAEFGRDVLRTLKGRVVRVIEKACVVSERPTVACVEWIEPLMAAGNWVPELVEIAGGRNLFGAPGRHSPPLDWEALRASDPDILVIMPCGFDLRRTRDEAAALAKHPGWAKLRAVRRGRVCVTDGSQYFNRPGPRIVESLEIMGEICHPDHFNFGHRGRDWERL